MEAVERLFARTTWPAPPPGFERLGPYRPMRQVLRGLLEPPGGSDAALPAVVNPVVVKWSRPATATDHVARALRGGKGAREGRLLRTLAERAVPVPRVLGFTDEGSDLLVLEDVAGLLPLPDGDRASPEQVTACARLLARAWRAGLRHRDLHRGNLALLDDRPMLLDMGGARLASKGGKVRELARARSAVAGDLSRSTRLRALKAWLTEAEGEPSRARLHDLARRVERRASRITRAYRRGRDRRATRSGRHYEVFRTAEGGAGIRRRDTPATWKEIAASLIDADPPQAKPLKPGGRVVSARLPNDDGEVVLKRYATVVRGRLPRAIRAFRWAAVLEHRGIEAPRSLLAISDARRRSLLISRCLEGEDLHRFTGGGRAGVLARLSPTRRMALCEALGRFLRHLHDAGISHRDLKAPNLFVERENAGRDLFAVTDLDGVRRRAVSWRRRARDLARLDASLDARSTDRARVLCAYFRPSPRPPVSKHTFARWIARHVRRKRGPSGQPR